MAEHSKEPQREKHTVIHKRLHSGEDTCPRGRLQEPKWGGLGGGEGGWSLKWPVAMWRERHTQWELMKFCYSTSLTSSALGPRSTRPPLVRALIIREGVIIRCERKEVKEELHSGTLLILCCCRLAERQKIHLWIHLLFFWLLSISLLFFPILKLDFYFLTGHVNSKCCSKRWQSYSSWVLFSQFKL